MVEFGIELRRPQDAGAPIEIVQSVVSPDVAIFVSDEAFLFAWGEAGGATDVGAFVNAPAATGALSRVRIDRRNGEISANTDRFGLFPILVHQRADRVLLAGHGATMASLLGAEASPDPRAALELLAYGQLLGTRTTLREVSQLPAGALLKMRFGQRPEMVTSPLVLSDRHCPLDAAIATFVRAVDARMKAAIDPVIPISGGLDSRLILAAALATGHRPRALCFGAGDSADLRIAKEMADAVGVELVTGTIVADGFDSAVADIAVRGAGAVPLHHGHALAVPALVAETSGATLLTGTGAETYRAFYYERGMPGLELLGTKLLRGRLLKPARRYAREAFERTLAPVRGALPSAALWLDRTLDERLDVYAGRAPDAARYLDAVYLGERVNRFVVAGQQMLDATYRRAHPYLDPSVVTACSGLPIPARFGGAWQRAAIARLAPKLAGVTWDRTMRPLADGLDWRQRWPGLAARLGRRGAYGKAGAPLATYGDWMSKDCSELASALVGCGIAEADVASGLASLAAGPLATHLQGVAGAWKGWTSHLASPRRLREIPLNDRRMARLQGMTRPRDRSDLPCAA